MLAVWMLPTAEIPLTSTQVALVRALGAGVSNADIAATLGLTEEDVRLEMLELARRCRAGITEESEYPLAAAA